MDQATLFFPFSKVSTRLSKTMTFCKPYGMRATETQAYRYSFQGQEADHEIKDIGNSINYKYRMHDPRLGRFFAVDPLGADFAWNSPYAFSENVVINAVELEGLEKLAKFAQKNSSIK